MNSHRSLKPSQRAVALVSTAVAAALSGASFQEAHAQQQQQSAQGMLEEIVVTSRRRDESLQDVPISVTALTPAFLREQNIVNTEELSDFVPNLRISEGQRAGSDQFSIRGVSRQGPGGDPTTNPGVGLYLNGVYIPAGIGNHLSLHDAERVEVLRGPQGTLFGRNTTGGAINIVTTRPQPEPHGEVLARTGSHDRRDVRLMVNAPVAETLYGRVSAALDRRDGYYKNLLLGTDHNDRNVRTIDTALRWEAADQLTFDLSARFMSQRENNRGGDCRFLQATGFQLTHENNGGGNFEEACRETEAAGKYNFYSAWPMHLDVEHETVTAEVNWVADGSVGFLDYLELNGNVGYFEVNYDFQIDQHYTRELLETRGTTGGGQTEIYKNAEFILEGRTGIANVLLGVNWYDEIGWQNKESFDRCYDLYAAVAGTGESVVCPSPGGFYFQNQPFNASGAGPSPFLGNVEATSEVASAFLHANFDLTTWFRMDAGMRYTRETRAFKNLEASIVPHEAPFLDWQLVLNDDTVALFGEGRNTWTKVTPTVSANFLVDNLGPIDNGMFYLLWSRGFTSGGFNTELEVREIPELRPLQTFAPETLDNYEIGMKATWLNRRLQVNLALFRMEYSDKQESIGIDNSDGTFGPITAIQITSNAAEAEIEGFELEFVAMLTERLRLDGGYARQSPRFTFFEGYNPATGQIEDLTNLRLNTEPKYTFTGNLQYTQPLASGARINARLGAYYQSGTDTAVPEFGITERTVCFQPSYTTVNARLTYNTPADNFAVSLFGRNLTNEEVLANCGLAGSRGRWVPMYQDRATWGLEGIFRF